MLSVRVCKSVRACVCVCVRVRVFVCVNVLHIRLPLSQRLCLPYPCFFPIVFVFRLPRATRFHPHRQLHLRLQSECGVSCRFVSQYSVQSVLGGFVVGGAVAVAGDGVGVGCVGSRGRMWNAQLRIHVHCYLHLWLHLWSAVVHWQWVVVVSVSVLEVLEAEAEAEAVEMWVWDRWHRSGYGYGSVSGFARHMNVHYARLDVPSRIGLRLSRPLAPSAAHSNLSRDRDTLARAAHTAAAVAHAARILDNSDGDDDDKSCPYRSDTQCSSADCGLCSSRGTGIVS